MVISVLVVDDSAFMRKVISEMINSHSELKVVATARNGQDALRKIRTQKIDVVTLDVEMPILNGLDTLRIIMESNPLPVIMVSSVTKFGSEVTLKALSIGAIDFIVKPSGAISLDMEKTADELISKIHTAAQVKLKKRTQSVFTENAKSSPPKTATISTPNASDVNVLVVIGASTGGPPALEKIFSQLLSDIKAAILVVQHMPKGFTKSFAERLNSVSPIHVKEASMNDKLQNGCAYIAPGDYHMTISQQKRIILNQGPPVQFLRPAIDVTMQTLPDIFNSNIIGVILTGMGRDGADGMSNIKQKQGITIAQDQATSTIYSMPKAVYEAGNADYILPIERISTSISKLVDTLY